jgi:hypothetical protein
MTIEKLIKYCVQYLEQGSDVDIMSSTVAELGQDDTFSEYINNIEHSIYMALTRYASSNVLMLQEEKFADEENTLSLVKEFSLPRRNADLSVIRDSDGKVVYKDAIKMPIYHKIKEVYAETNSGEILPSVEYYVIAGKIKIKKYNPKYKYYVLYYPNVNDFEFYLKEDDINIYNIELSDLGVTDEMAINIKYFVYSELKLEENPNLANVNKNYFETYLSSLEEIQVANIQTELSGKRSADIYSDDVTYDKEWSDIYGN